MSLTEGFFRIKFLNKIFTKQEIEYCERKNIQKFQSYAVRFAAKEACYKALSSYIDFEYKWTDFEILNDNIGRPEIKLNFKIDNLESIDVSLSHEKKYAIANVTCIIKDAN